MVNPYYTAVLVFQHRGCHPDRHLPAVFGYYGYPCVFNRIMCLESILKGALAMTYFRAENIETMFAQGFRILKTGYAFSGFIKGRYNAVPVDGENAIANAIENQLAQFLFQNKTS